MYNAKRYCPHMWRRWISGLLIWLLLGNAFPSAGFAKPIAPKVGSCLLYAQNEVQAPTSKKLPVNCRSLHNVEVYRVVAAPFKKDPNTEPPISLLVKVASICEPGVSSSNFFTGWGFKVPNKFEWKKGARWLRCEAFALQTESETATFASWKGKKLDFK